MLQKILQCYTFRFEIYWNTAFHPFNILSFSVRIIIITTTTTTTTAATTIVSRSLQLFDKLTVWGKLNVEVIRLMFLETSLEIIFFFLM